MVYIRTLYYGYSFMPQQYECSTIRTWLYVNTQLVQNFSAKSDTPLELTLPLSTPLDACARSRICGGWIAGPDIVASEKFTASSDEGCAVFETSRNFL